MKILCVSLLSVVLIFSCLSYGSGLFVPTANYSGSNNQTIIQAVLGSAAEPESSQDATAIIQKTTNNSDTSGVNQSLYVSIVKLASGFNNRVSAIFSEAQDNAGGSGSFVEGIRAHATLNGYSGSGYGGVFMAGTNPGKDYEYLIAVEGEARNQSGVDAPSYFDKTKFSASFLATGQGTNSNDAGFATNPFNPVDAKFREGFLVAEDSVTDAAFRSRATTVWGLDLTQGDPWYGAIGIPNSRPIRATNGAGTGSMNILFVDQYNKIIIGTETGGVNLQPVSGGVAIGTWGQPTSKLQVVGLPVYSNNSAAIAGGLTAGAFYRSSGNPSVVCVVY